MVQSEETYNKLYDAAVTIYKYLDKEKGFYSGSVKTPDGRWEKTYNSFTGAKIELEKKMYRALNKFEITMLSLAIDFGPTPALTDAERQQAFNDLWDGKPNRERTCLVFDRLVTCI